MSYRSKRELLAQIAPRYQLARHGQKSVILDECIAATGYARKYAIRVLTRPPLPAPAQIRRPRLPHYGAEVQAALEVAWAAVTFVGAKRLVPFLPTLVPIVERHHHLTLTEEVRAQLLAVSSATVDRVLRVIRRTENPHGISTTKAGALLTRQIPVRTFADWDEGVPGFLEADLVAHCGPHPDGAFLVTLVLTDVATGWLECQALLYRSQDQVLHGLRRARQLIPFPVRGLDTDNGGEFITNELITSCAQEQITFTRGRPYHKNDPCFVEQKNGAVVRHFVGYDRDEGAHAYRQLVELYRALRLYVNFFQPVSKLVGKSRQGAKVHKVYDIAQTPYQRLLRSGVLTEQKQRELAAIYEALNPVALLKQIRQEVEHLWTLADRQPSLANPIR